MGSAEGVDDSDAGDEIAADEHRNLCRAGAVPPQEVDGDETEETVALPQLTDEQRAAALEKAAAARRLRAELKDRRKAARAGRG